MDSSPQTRVVHAVAPGFRPVAGGHTSAFGPADAATVAPGVDPRLAFELRRWQYAEPGQSRDGYTLAWLVACHIRAHGRDHLDSRLLIVLAEIRQRHGADEGRDRFLDAYLDCVLARHQGRFGAREYLALPLLQLITADRRSGLSAERLTVLLIADVIRYESQPESVAALDGYTRVNRALHAARFIAEAEPTLGSGAPTPPGTAAGEWMALTVLPVSAAHDEYLLIRALQAQELLFGLLAEMITAATGSAAEGDLAGAAATVRRAHKVFRRVGTLARMVSTMRGDDVEDVAEHVAGTSALRSEAYQRFARACRAPSARVGAVEADRGAGVDRGGLAGAVADRRGPLTSPELAELMDAMAALEAAHQAWKALHHGPAAAIVGADSAEAPPVLHVQDCMNDRLFGSDALREVFGSAG